MSLADTLRSRLSLPVRAELLSGDGPERDATGAIAAAVLIAITDRAEPGLLLTVRREHLRTHAGQVAFPGGRVDHGEDAVEAALREAQEEILLDPAEVEVVAAIEPYLTVTDYLVTPVVAVVTPDLALAPHEPEVADLFEAPLGFVLDPSNQVLQSALFHGRTRHYYQINWNGRRIWGATAAMIVNLSRRLEWH